MALIDEIAQTPVLNSQHDRGEEARLTLLDRYRAVRSWTERLIEPLAVEDMVVQTSTECSPTKWQLGHTTWFFETFVLASVRGYRPFHERYGFLFNSYYNSVGERVARPVRGLMSRPTVQEVLDYRSHVDTAMERAIVEQSSEWWSEYVPIIDLGIHHEQQHQELIVTDVKTVLAMNPLRPVYRSRRIDSQSVPPLRWSEFEGGLVTIGHSGEGFAFDNESPRHAVFLEPFALANRLVTNAEYREFIDAGGYGEPRFWLSDGWAHVQTEGWRAPRYWEEREGEWWMATLQGDRPVEPSEPVTHVSHYEADAYAAWAGARLPTEFEWEHAVVRSAVERHGNFVEREHFHPVPVRDESGGLDQVYGDVWEWTRSAYLPYPGYSAKAGALGEYNGKFMSNQMVLRGGSCVTPTDHVRASYRNFFPPEARWQFSGIRVARDLSSTSL